MNAFIHLHHFISDVKYYTKGVFTMKIVSAKKSSLGNSLKKSVKQEMACVVHSLIISKKNRQGAVSAES